MKLRTFPVVVALAVGLLIGSVGSAFAAEMFEGLPVVKVLLNGAPLKADVPPVVLAGRTLLPVRAIADAVGLDVKWDAATSTVLLTSKAPTHSSLLYADTFVTVANEMVMKDNMGMTVLMLDVTNHYSEAVSGPITATFFDHEGMVLGKASTTVKELKAGATATIELMVEKNVAGYSHYKLSSDIMSHH